MDTNGKINYLLTHLDGYVQSFKHKRIYNRNKAFLFRVAIIICGLFTTILIGMHGIDASAQPVISNMALIFSALITALGAIDSYLDHRSLWIRYTTTYNQLMNLQSKLEYIIAGDSNNIDDSKVDEIFDELQQIMKATNNDWLHLRKEKEMIKTGKTRT